MAGCVRRRFPLFPLARFDPALLEELKNVAASSVRIEGDQLIVKHMYIEKRLIPLDLFLRESDESSTRRAIRDTSSRRRSATGSAPRDCARSRSR